MQNEKADPLLHPPGTNQPQVVVGQVTASQPQVVVAQVVSAEQVHVVQIPQEAGPGGSLLPYPDRPNWHSGEFDKCCTCTGDCWVAWCCSCFTAGQIASKLSKVGNPYCLGYKGIVITFLFFFILDIILESTAGVDLNPQYLFMFVVMMQLRKRVRDTLRIDGDCCSDCVCSFFCPPCVLTQMVHTLWARPNQVPGCDCSEGAADKP
mmetsp:Transcript_14923/g.35170  ORF Transcript_14923/g.35170 Transcript_14923/m.35170 type:complete len:207 (+) Transcript_14923:27-647(+)